MESIELYKLLVTEDNKLCTPLAGELGWVSNDEFLVWISYFYVNEFVQSMVEIFGNNLFDDGGFNANFQSDSICFDLEEILGGYDIDLKIIFPQDKYKH
ncbi:MAG: hypothetical protein Q8936_21675 [Bacillota bacterium]|nr:hypothetical protein [Bacillota bacterium]